MYIKIAMILFIMEKDVITLYFYRVIICVSQFERENRINRSEPGSNITEHENPTRGIIEGGCRKLV